MSDGAYQVERGMESGVDVVTLREGDGGAKGAVARVCPGLGANCFEFNVRGRTVMERVTLEKFKAGPTGLGFPILFPYANRIRDGRFELGGRKYQLDPPRHGFVRQRPWKAKGMGATAKDGAWVTCTFDAADFGKEILGQFPHRFVLGLTYRLRGGVLSVELEAENRGETAMPYCYGTHPYFHREVDSTVMVPAGKRWELKEALPTGKVVGVEEAFDLRKGRGLDVAPLDDIFTGLEGDAKGMVTCAIGHGKAGGRTVVRFDGKVIPHVVVFTPPGGRMAVCVEPYTGPTDVFNLGLDEKVTGGWKMGAGEKKKWVMEVGFEW